MRVVSYNILDGGEGRADPLAEVIEAQRPDVVCLAEASDLAVVERIANRLKMDFVQACGRKKGAASALLTRYTIRESVNHALLREGLSKSLLEATLVEPGGPEWVFGDRKSTRLNSSHVEISYAVFCLKKKKEV